MIDDKMRTKKRESSRERVGPLTSALLWLYVGSIVAIKVLEHAMSDDPWQSGDYLISGRELADAWGSPFAGHDASSYYMAAWSWYSTGILQDQGWQWVTNLWPPGMVFQNYFILTTFGQDGPVLLITALVTISLWTVVLSLYLTPLLGDQRFGFVPWIAPAIFVSIYPVSEWILDSRMVYPTGYSIATFLLGVQLLQRSLKRSTDGNGSFRWSIFAGIAFGCSAFYRVTGVYVLYLIVAIVVTSLALQSVRLLSSFQRYNRCRRERAMALRKRRSIQADLCQYFASHRAGTTRRSSRDAVAVLLAVLIATTMVQLWTEFVTREAHPGNRVFVTEVDELAHGMRWRTDEHLNNVGAWLLGTSTNWACRISPSQCSEIERLELASTAPYSGSGHFTGEELRNLALKAALLSPFEYIAERTPYLISNWNAGHSLSGLALGVLTVGAICLGIARLLSKGRPKLLDAVWLSYILLTLVPMLYILFFPYYFFPAQLGSFFYLIHVFGEKAQRHSG